MSGWETISIRQFLVNKANGLTNQREDDLNNGFGHKIVYDVSNFGLSYFCFICGVEALMSSRQKQCLANNMGVDNDD